jgi:sigma-B regulation protein RsbU (phosphoserine phosphatase)
MADVSGKGIGAALLMSNFQANVKAIFQGDVSDLHSKINLLNTRVMESAQGEKYITFFVAIFDRRAKSVMYVNCGHNPPLWIDEKGISSLLELGSVGLGMFENLPTIESGELKALPGSSLICYTDGLVEQENSNAVPFGMSRMEKIVRDSVGASLDEMHIEMVKQLTKFRGNTPPLDDTALLSCRFK